MVAPVSTSPHPHVAKSPSAVLGRFYWPVTALVWVVALAIGPLYLVACGDDDDGEPKPVTAVSEYADMTIYFQQAVYNDVTYTCLLSGYSNAPAMWCERTPEEELYP